MSDMTQRERGGKCWRARLLRGTAIALICAGGPGYAAPAPASARAEIEAVRAGAHDGWVRLVVELSAAGGNRVIFSDDGRFAEIDLDGAGWPENVASILLEDLPGSGLVRAIDGVAGGPGGIGRLRLGFAVPARLRRRFSLRPMDGKPWRLVFDFEAAPPLISPAITPASITPAVLSLPALVTAPQAVAATTHPVPAPVPVAPPARPNSADRTALLRPEDLAAETPPPPPWQQPPAPGRDIPTTAEATGSFPFEISGRAEWELRLFPDGASRPGQHDSDASVALEPRIEATSDDGDQLFTFVPFGRIDLRDGARSHFDIRELKWTGVFGPLEVRLGIDRVFWGVTEAVHLVDIINQTDLIEDIDDEDRLGQPMAVLSYESPLGTFSAYLLPYFRKLVFPGPRGRPGTPLPIDNTQVQFESGSNRWHADWALRWTKAIGPLDIGAAHFSGTARDPRLLPGSGAGGQPVLIPRYDLIDQTSVDVQATLGALLLKFEGITVAGPGPRYNAFDGGFEYTFFGLGGGSSDLGILAEFIYDDRGRLSPSPFEQDLFVGFRWTPNDAQNSQFLAGAILDLDTRARAVNIEASRRLLDDWVISVDARLFLTIPPADPLFPIRHDDFIQIRLGRYF